MNANSYQIQCRQFDNHRPETKLYALAFGLVAEAGEVANEFERMMRDEHGLDEDKVRYELGDVLWNVARLADVMGWTLEGIMQANIDKLTARYQELGLELQA